MITTQIRFDDFWTWLQTSGSYKNNFSYEGAEALFKYLDDYYGGDTTDDTQLIDNYDPVAWCASYSEYSSVSKAYKEYYGDDSDLPKSQRRTTKSQQLEYFADNTIIVSEKPFVIASF